MTDELTDLGQRLAAGRWRIVGAVAEGESILLGGFILGVNPWRYKWQSLEATIEMPHLSYPSEMHVYKVYRIKTWCREIVFAARELSPGVFGFCVPDSNK